MVRVTTSALGGTQPSLLHHGAPSPPQHLLKVVGGAICVAQRLGVRLPRESDSHLEVHSSCPRSIGKC